MNDEQLLAEVEDILRTMPSKTTPDDSDLYWVGRAKAVLHKWDSIRSVFFMPSIDRMLMSDRIMRESGFKDTSANLHQVQHDLRMKTLGPVNVAVGAGMVHEYFDTLRQTIEQATTDILFVDPYMDADFVSKYLVHVKSGVATRLLTAGSTNRLAVLLPAVGALANQNQSQIGVRTSSSLHDRYLFIDNTSCYQSGASFKDGAVGKPTVITQITDAFGAMHTTYEKMWNGAIVQR